MSFDQLFENATRLPSIPKIVQELLQTFDNPDADMKQVANKIALEPVLTAKLLRTANASHYGLPRKVASVQDAVIVLGFSAVRTLVMASGLVTSLQLPAALDKKQFWTDAFAIAETAKWLGKFGAKVDPNTLATAGLVHTVGQLLMYSVYPEQATKVKHAVAAGQSRLEAEQAVFGYTYCVVGAELAKRWKFPTAICEALLHQNAPLAANPFSLLGAYLYLAKHVHSCLQAGVPVAELIEHFPSAVCDRCEIKVEKLFTALEKQDGFPSPMGAILDD
jgi:HD-like signal output (HDOD) protein